MRRTNSRRSRFVYAFSILILLLLSIVTISTTVIAQDGDQLFIAIYDNEKQDWLALDEEDPIFLEGNEYDIEIYYENEMGIPINVYDVNIDFLGTSNFIASGAEFPYIQI